MVTSRDIDAIISKLSSDKVRPREDGIKLLNRWLEGDKSTEFCKHLSKNTLNLKPDEIPHSQTWPFILNVLIDCVALEIHSSKKRSVIFAKTLRVVVERADDSKYSGNMVLLLPVVKSLFNHIWDVLNDASSFQSEYGIILRHLLAIKEYRCHMRKRIYCSLVLFYMGKVKISFNGKSNAISNMKGELFQCILSLHSLLENPPGDFPDNLRADIVEGFVAIFSHIRDEGKFSPQPLIGAFLVNLRKLIECINTYLIKDGPNLDSQSMEIHSAVQEFVFHHWLTTYDRGLKDAFVLYARMQLKLIRSAVDGSHLVEQLVDVIGKELDQSNSISSGVSWFDQGRDEKLGTLNTSQCGLMELAASLLYRVCVNTTKLPATEKRPRIEHAASRLREALMEGKWLWNCAFSFLVRNYHSRLQKGLLIYWFEGICESFERILNDGNSTHAYDSLLWVLRSLNELSSVCLPLASSMETSQVSSLNTNEIQFGSGWNTIWSCLVQGLPIFSNVASVADAALVLLGKIIRNNLIGVPTVPLDVWDLRLFKHMPSQSALYFIACYFTKKGSQGDIRDNLHLRQNLLRAVFGLLNLKESFGLNESMTMLLPAAIFSLCAASAPFPDCLKGLSLPNSFMDVYGAVDDLIKAGQQDREFLYQYFECSVEVIAAIGPRSSVKVSESQPHHAVRLPRQIWHPLLQEMETCFLVAVMDKHIEKMNLPDLFFLCALLCNCIYGSIFARVREENTSFLTKTSRLLSELLQRAVSIIEENHNDHQDRGSIGYGPFPEGEGPTLSAIKTFICCPLFSIWKDQILVDSVLSRDLIEVIERLLWALSKVFKECSEGTRNVPSEILLPQRLCSSGTSLDGSIVRVVDMDLDVNENSRNIDLSPASVSGIPYSSAKWKCDIILVIARFYSLLPVITWEVMHDLMKKEMAKANEFKVCDHILFCLCEHFSWSSTNLSDLVISMHTMVEIKLSLKRRCVDILTAIRLLLGTLQSTSSRWKEYPVLSGERTSELSLVSLGELVNKIAEVDLLDWSERIVLIECICNFVILDPCTGQVMFERLFTMLQDTDYRVRIFLARQIGILFQTWEDHDVLFKDICSHFGVKLVISSQEVVTAREVLAAGPQSRPIMETVIVTLGHLAFYSEKIEVEAIFMICVVAAIEPCQRELVYTVLDNLSRHLQYTTRSKYLEALIGMILYSWVACRVSLALLLEIRDLFLLDAEPIYFMQYCCPWLLPALILGEDTTNLKWVATVAGQPLPALVKNYFVQVFGVCMALHCSKKPSRGIGAVVLQSSILRIAEMSEQERDTLIKKHMVSIVSFILSLSSSASDPPLPFFSRDIIVLAIQNVVDGFLEMDDRPSKVGVTDKINIFRADRIFMFIVEMHYKVSDAVHHRHKCHRLSGIEVLINIIGHRAAVSSTSNYLFNLVGQFIGCQALQEQCCLILSKLCEAFKLKPSKDVTGVLGEQLQFLVSKLVACCIPSEGNGEVSGSSSSQVFSLIHQLIVDSDPCLYDYIKELEPFPEIDCFDGVRRFHHELCKAYSPRDHFLKFVRRTYLPHRLLLWSLQTMHKKLLTGEIIQLANNEEDTVRQFNSWHCEQEIASAVWMLVDTCGSNEAKNIRALVSDFISRAGIGDPHCVVFHLPGDSKELPLLHPSVQGGSIRGIFYTNNGIPDELLVTLVRLLKKYLLDESVRIIDITSKTLQGIFSTEKGQRALLSFDSYERSLLEVHSKGINNDLIQKLLSHSERKYNAEVISIENSLVWNTKGKTYEMWICPLVYSLIDHTSDTILRLCQDLSLLKAEVAELLFSSVLVNLAGRSNLNIDLCKLISSQVQENIFTETNELTKSTQVFLDALNELRLCHVLERTTISSTTLKRESLKQDKPSNYSSRSRSKSDKSKTPADASTATATATASSASVWEKVYWLTIDYLLVAKSAVSCGSYFTSVMYVEHWCEDKFNGLMLGSPDFSPHEMIPPHIEILISAVTQINDPDSLYGIIRSDKLTSQIITFEHERNWSKALEYYDLQVRSEGWMQPDQGARQASISNDQVTRRTYYKGLMRSLQQTGCTHVLDLYCQGLTSQKGHFQHDSEFTELQYEAAWRAGNWDFSLLHVEVASSHSRGYSKSSHFNENLHSCLRALQEGDSSGFHTKLIDSKQEIVFSIYQASKESTKYIHSSIIKLQILDHLGMAWDLRWRPSPYKEMSSRPEKRNCFLEPISPTINELEELNIQWSSILKRTQLHMNLLEPFIAFRRVLLHILNCKDCTVQHLLQSASTLRKSSSFSLAATVLHEFKFLTSGTEGPHIASYICFLGRLEETKLLRAQGQPEMAINLAKYILHHYQLDGEASNVYRLVGKWLAETRSCNSRIILENYLKRAVELTEGQSSADRKSIERQCQTHFHLAHYADALFRSYEERLSSNEWQAAMRLRKHKTKELEALIRRLKSSAKEEKTDYSIKIQELQKQLSMDREEAEKLQDDRDNFLGLALEGYQRCLVVGDKYDLRVVFRLVSLWFTLSSRQNVINGMLSAVKEVQSYKFIPLVYQIASRMGSSKDGQGAHNFQFALVSLVKKMSIDHPYHTIFQLLALANGDRVKDKQRSRNSFVVDMDKKLTAENLLSELSSHHGAIIRQIKQMVEIYIKLAELETKREDTNKRIPLPREIRSLRQLELVPVVTATFPVDHSCQYHEGTFPHFKGLADSIMVMNGINAPKVVECLGSDGRKYRQLAKSGNDDLRQDAVMEQFFGLVNTFLQNHSDTWKRRIGIRTYKVVPFTPSAGVLEWVDGTIPLGEYLLGSMRNGGAHGRYGVGDWSFLQCREYMTNGKDKPRAFQEVCEKFRPVMHYFFLERFLQPANWFDKRLSYTRSVAASSMVGYIVGLGDRHSMNILIDQATAEVVHIDLGVAFEQGLMLKTPERVPFRLTRDIIDGMGVTGVEGVFRRCCEETLSVMRTNKEALLTIIEVFIHDPLYKWALSPLKALQLQKETDDDILENMEDSQDVYMGNKDAARALMRVKQKLDGYEEGEMRSVHGQVQQLIQDAIDQERLCQMFPGWGAWL